MITGLFFCNKPVTDEKLRFCNRKRYTIPIYKRQEVIDEINKYCPNRRDQISVNLK